ncbi:hypothetical protein SNEBB_002184 [Seison nebaliae]|nr:hypothetical protein SNEBB_002184 [Seison nebaliae]
MKNNTNPIRPKLDSVKEQMDKKKIYPTPHRTTHQGPGELSKKIMDTIEADEMSGLVRDYSHQNISTEEEDAEELERDLAIQQQMERDREKGLSSENRIIADPNQKLSQEEELAKILEEQEKKAERDEVQDAFNLREQQLLGNKMMLDSQRREAQELFQRQLEQRREQEEIRLHELQSRKEQEIRRRAELFQQRLKAREEAQIQQRIKNQLGGQNFPPNRLWEQVGLFGNGNRRRLLKRDIQNQQQHPHKRKKELMKNSKNNFRTKQQLGRKNEKHLGNVLERRRNEEILKKVNWISLTELEEHERSRRNMEYNNVYNSYNEEDSPSQLLASDISQGLSDAESAGDSESVFNDMSSKHDYPNLWNDNDETEGIGEKRQKRDFFLRSYDDQRNRYNQMSQYLSPIEKREPILKEEPSKEFQMQSANERFSKVQSDIYRPIGTDENEKNDVRSFIKSDIFKVEEKENDDQQNDQKSRLRKHLGENFLDNIVNRLLEGSTTIYKRSAMSDTPLTYKDILSLNSKEHEIHLPTYHFRKINRRKRQTTDQFNSFHQIMEMIQNDELEKSSGKIQFKNEMSKRVKHQIPKLPRKHKSHKKKKIFADGQQNAKKFELDIKKLEEEGKEKKLEHELKEKMLEHGRKEKKLEKKVKEKKLEKKVKEKKLEKKTKEKKLEKEVEGEELGKKKLQNSDMNPKGIISWGQLVNKKRFLTRNPYEIITDNYYRSMEKALDVENEKKVKKSTKVRAARVKQCKQCGQCKTKNKYDKKCMKYCSKGAGSGKNSGIHAGPNSEENGCECEQAEGSSNEPTCDAPSAAPPPEPTSVPNVNPPGVQMPYNIGLTLILPQQGQAAPQSEYNVQAMPPVAAPIAPPPPPLQLQMQPTQSYYSRQPPFAARTFVPFQPFPPSPYGAPKAPAANLRPAFKNKLLARNKKRSRLTKFKFGGKNNITMLKTEPPPHTDATHVYTLDSHNPSSTTPFPLTTNPAYDDDYLLNNIAYSDEGSLYEFQKKLVEILPTLKSSYNSMLNDNLHEWEEAKRLKRNLGILEHSLMPPPYYMKNHGFIPIPSKRTKLKKY